MVENETIETGCDGADHSEGDDVNVHAAAHFIRYVVEAVQRARAARRA